LPHGALDAGRQVLVELCEVTGCCRRKRPHDDARPSRQVVEVSRRGGAKAALHQIPVHSIANGFGNDKTDLWRFVSPRVLGEMNHHGRSSRAHATSHRPLKIYGTAQTVRRG
jgi:hypothetical protein